MLAAHVVGVMRRLAIIALCVVASGTARAERSNGLYFEMLGKGGLWGVGFDHRLEHRLYAGIVGSGGGLGDERYYSLSPYLGFHLLHCGRSAWFLDGGIQFAQVWAVTPVPEWNGTSTSGVGGLASSGYEFRGRLLLRLYLHAAFGRGGVLPWAGADVGFTF